MDSSLKATDKMMMARCIELSRIAVSEGEYPFGTVIALDGQVWWKRSTAQTEMVT